MSGTTLDVQNGNVYLKEIDNIIQYSFDNNSYSNIIWPLTIERNQIYTDVITVYIVNNLTITDNSQYLIVGTNNITFNGYYNTLYQIITLNIQSYDGFIQNGSGNISEQSIVVSINQTVNTLSVTSSVNGYSDINIQNIKNYKIYLCCELL
jgi:hypothetical protein